MALADSISAEGDDAPLDEAGHATDGLSAGDRSRPRNRRGLLFAALALSAILTIFGLHLWSQASTRADGDAGSTRNAASETTRSTPRLERLTNTSAATGWPALSSDGRMLAYVSDGGQDGTAPQIWLQQIGGAAMRLTSGQRDCTDLAFSADDTRIIFTARGDAGRNVYEVPTLGGDPRLLVPAATGGRFSPDGKWLAYVALDAPGGLRIASRDATGVRSLGSALIDVSGPAWSPDSRGVLVRAHADSAFEPDYWMVLVDGGAPINTRNHPEASRETVRRDQLPSRVGARLPGVLGEQQQQRRSLATAAHAFLPGGRRS